MSTNLLRDLRRKSEVAFGVNLCYLGLAVSQGHLRRFQSESTANFGRVPVPQLMRMPVRDRCGLTRRTTRFRVERLALVAR